jgi:hypothetical protein
MKKSNIILVLYLGIITVISFSTMYIDYFSNVGQAYYDDYMTVVYEWMMVELLIS